MSSTESPIATATAAPVASSAPPAKGMRKNGMQEAPFSSPPHPTLNAEVSTTVGRHLPTDYFSRYRQELA